MVIGHTVQTAQWYAYHFNGIISDFVCAIFCLVFFVCSVAVALLLFVRKHSTCDQLKSFVYINLHSK